ncbi:GAF domain-containing protein [Massilia sp. IC2-477]|uniref:GAF domain-containing protein n=1 Tax=unclassified Massilia TaxID=2609279 RepID=UPI001D128427|nr:MULTISPECIES: GAF domain-containing protein [unclassified Massilia]MCC2955072.1 GAF domain-containing protein [Massilia sp. IC2-477]MCC2973066.1 GAF domain-containing protein [Massilia sp. IC2-476]
MNNDAKHLLRLQDVQDLLASGSLDDNLVSHAELARRLVGATSCSVMLLSSDAPDDLRMRVCASAGDMPPDAADALVGSGEGICGRVLASGRALLVEDIARSEFASLARRRRAAVPALMSAPVRIDGRIVGVLNVTGVAFSETELQLLEVTALFIGKSVQTIQLQGLLASRFAQMALVREAQQSGADATAYQNPEDVARILARSFYKEMTRAGFAAPQIVSAATELIGQLGGAIQESGRTA